MPFTALVNIINLLFCNISNSHLKGYKSRTENISVLRKFKY